MCEKRLLSRLYEPTRSFLNLVIFRFPRLVECFRIMLFQFTAFQEIPGLLLEEPKAFLYGIRLNHLERSFPRKKSVEHIIIDKLDPNE